jgi:uncharacterized membrane protein YhhN
MLPPYIHPDCSLEELGLLYALRSEMPPCYSGWQLAALALWATGDAHLNLPGYHAHGFHWFNKMTHLSFLTDFEHCTMIL